MWRRRVRISMVSGAEDGVSGSVARASDGRMPLRVVTALRTVLDSPKASR